MLGAAAARKPVRELRPQVQEVFDISLLAVLHALALPCVRSFPPASLQAFPRPTGIYITCPRKKERMMKVIPTPTCPQALPYKLLAMGAVAVAANVPCGMWREHTSKFSPEWFLAVHATIPFVAMLRKAVLMPKWAVLLTVLGAVAGQQVRGSWVGGWVGGWRKEESGACA